MPRTIEPLMASPDSVRIAPWLPAVRTSGESASIVKGIFRISFN